MKTLSILWILFFNLTNILASGVEMVMDLSQQKNHLVTVDPRQSINIHLKGLDEYDRDLLSRYDQHLPVKVSTYSVLNNYHLGGNRTVFR